MPAASGDDLAILTLKMLAVDGVEKAKSGHPGAPLGCMDMAWVLWSKFLRFNPDDPSWPDRDRFVLSNGHASMLLYSLLHAFGYPLPMEELKNFRQLGSKTPGHPEYGLTPGVEVTTGPLGQGFAHGVGMAVAAKMLESRFPEKDGFAPVGHRVWGIVSDGDLMEGVASEAASMAGFWKLDNLCYLYDDNEITIDGSTSLAFSEDVAKRFESYGWHAERIDGHDREAIERSLAAAAKRTGKPTLIVARTVIGQGAPNKAGSHKVHGEPLGADEIKATKESLGWPAEPTFLIPDEAREQFARIVGEKKTAYEAWKSKMEGWKKSDPDAHERFQRHFDPKLPEDFDARILEAVEDKDDATRKHSGAALQKAAELLPNLVGGSADLQPSNNTKIEGAEAIAPGNFAGRNFHYGVREHGMVAVANGLTLHGGFRGFGASFLIFSDYCRPSLRLASLMQIASIHVFTHDSIFLGEDGPTHQPIEQLAALRAIPRLNLFRPADAMETAMAWAWAISAPKGPTVLALTRQKVPKIARTSGFHRRDVWKGGYVVSDPADGAPEAVIIGTGSELHLAVGAAKALHAKGRKIRVVSLPCTDLFEQQDESYRHSVIPPHLPTAAVEAGSPMTWYKYTGKDGLIFGMRDFGESAPYKDLAKHFGFTVENVAASVEGWLSRKK